MMTWLVGRTVWARQDLWLAVDGASVFVPEGEPFSSRARVVKLWPTVFTDVEPPRVTVEAAI